MPRKRATAVLDRPELPLPVDERPAVKEALARVQAAQATRDSIGADDIDGTEKYARAVENVATLSLAYDEAVAEAEAELTIENLRAELDHQAVVVAGLEQQPGPNAETLVVERTELARLRALLAEATGQAVEVATIRREAESRAARQASLTERATQAATNSSHTAKNSQGSWSDLRAGPPQEGYTGTDFLRDHPIDSTWPYIAEPEPGLDTFHQVVELLDTFQPKTSKSVERVGRYAGSGEEVRYSETISTPGLGQLLELHSFGTDEAERLETARQALKSADSVTRPRLRLALHFYPLLRSTLETP